MSLITTAPTVVYEVQTRCIDFDRNPPHAGPQEIKQIKEPFISATIHAPSGTVAPLSGFVKSGAVYRKTSVM